MIGDEGVLITDTPFSPRAHGLKAEIAKLTDKPVTHIVLTHEHYDHVGGTEVFDHAKIICHQYCEEVFALDVMGMTPARVDVSYSDTMTLKIGETRVDLYHWGPGDGVGTTVLHLPKEKVVVSADMYEPRELTQAEFLHDKNFVGARLYPNRLADFEPEFAVNAHSPGLDPNDLYEARDYLNDLYDAVKTALDSAVAEQGVLGGFGAVMSLPDSLKLSKYEDWKNYEDLPAHVQRMALSIFHGG